MAEFQLFFLGAIGQRAVQVLQSAVVIEPKLSVLNLSSPAFRFQLCVQCLRGVM